MKLPARNVIFSNGAYYAREKEGEGRPMASSYRHCSNVFPGSWYRRCKESPESSRNNISCRPRGPILAGATRLGEGNEGGGGKSRFCDTRGQRSKNGLGI